jgi:hypothetical protein
MKSLLLATLMLLAAATALPMRGAVASPTTFDAPIAVYDEDDDEEEWKCSCTATCDGNTVKVSERACADDEDISEAVQEAADACARELDNRCEDEASCKCSCKPTGRDC